MYFTKNMRCECYCSHEMCIFVLCVVQFSAGNQKHLQSQYFLILLIKQTQQQYYCNLPPMVWYSNKFIADLQSNFFKTSNELTFSKAIIS